MSFGTILVILLPLVLETTGMGSACKCRTDLRPIAVNQMEYFRLPFKHSVYDHYVCLQEDVLSALKWQAHIIYPRHLQQHDEHEEQVYIN